MVSFSCEACGDVLTKKKLDPHRNRCRGATFTCIDCMVHFPGTEYRWHTSCMTEEQKYQGALYRDKKANAQSAAPSANKHAASNTMVQAAYVEDVAEDHDSWRDYEQRSDDDEQSLADPLPEAPTPPSALEAQRAVNVFDFLVANPTPTASHVSLPASAPIQLSKDTQLVRFDPDANGTAGPLNDDGAMVQYGTGPVPTNFETPAAKTARRKTKEGDKDAKKDKKRKRLHIETDHIMTDAPPVLHSGLTGGMSRLMSRPSVFPPSPDYSGGDAAETPASPLKKSKSKHHKSSRTTETLGNSLMAMITAGSKSKSTSKKRTKTKSSSTPSKPKKKRTAKALEAPKQQKLLEFTPGSKDGKEESGALVVFKPRAEHFLSFVNKGPESERGCSVNKALKRYHRERSASGSGLSKVMEEKELWRSLRMKKNERGEIVLFCLDD
ncbi:be8a4995-a1a8-48c6-8c89-23d5d5b6df57 [Thermothielavioides terrestris]|uniref:Zinc finger C2H2 LYAR-type domain-containing protein n=2 Tax=Thermothielavioides terrestris TaxID=2587410 RepID=G2RE52_THETT|nr:uncharacterized protein THITE_2120997 [Thermothielavioides terrestris NRRL 8126]AEO70079.1 hypothetical protein THITE_2120997 [Thermothielavioides terrestris NRRL 8126]SPQ17878.1 be8a4995-a1a8-48c6-8c89-23d5d5b6df57 [Thermothielavioides terrestris]